MRARSAVKKKILSLLPWVFYVPGHPPLAHLLSASYCSNDCCSLFGSSYAIQGSDSHPNVEKEEGPNNYSNLLYSYSYQRPVW